MPLLPLPRPRPLGAATLTGAALAGLALANHLAARRAERRHPPEGRFVEVDGVRLHYRDRGTGTPVVLIHGNAVTGEDWITSGVADLLAKTHRVILFDRPGFGHSARPHGRLWTAHQQAELLHKALRQLGVVRPVLVGHSWGTIVALALAECHQAEVAGLVLVSGYYFGTLRPDLLPVLLGAIPGVGDILRYTLSPLLGWLQMPLLKRAMFSPARVTPRFQAEYSPAMALRPSQIRATAQDGALMIPGALALRGRYKQLRLPVVILAGEGDRVVFKRRSEQLHAEIKGSVLQIVKGAGHMVHHLAPQLVAEAVEAVIRAARGRSGADERAGMNARRSGSARRELTEAV
jgi:pimeloyl-ACP methyl ester carboxylesterase